MIEHEVKLRFPDVEAARQALQRAGSRLVVSRRLLDDRLFDHVTRELSRQHSALRLRRDGATAVLTFKGPPEDGPLKSREEIETVVADPAAIEAILHALGYRPTFRSQKYREEFALDGTYAALDETPMGVFVEIEASTAEAVERAVLAIGRTRADYELESYPALWRRHCRERGLEDRDMTFEPPLPEDRRA